MKTSDFELPLILFQKYEHINRYNVEENKNNTKQTLTKTVDFLSYIPNFVFSLAYHVQCNILFISVHSKVPSVGIGMRYLMSLLDC